MGSSLPGRVDQGDQIARRSTLAGSERASLRASEPSDTVFGSLVHGRRIGRAASRVGAPVSDGGIIDGEIVEGEIVDDDAADPEPTPDADVVDADVVDEDVVDPHSLGESGIGDPAVIALLRDTTDETIRPARPIAADPASDAPVSDVLDPPTTSEPPPADDIAGLSFPRLSARTQRFTLGEPRNVVVSGDGTRVVFLRSRSGTDRYRERAPVRGASQR